MGPTSPLRTAADDAAHPSNAAAAAHPAVSSPWTPGVMLQHRARGFVPSLGAGASTFSHPGSSTRRGGPSALTAACHAPAFLGGVLLLLLGYGAGMLRHSCIGSGGAAASSRGAALAAPRAAAAGGEAASAAVAAAAAAARAAVGELPSANRTLRFQVCNGFTNQRLAVMYGVMLAKRLGRTAVVPALIDDGVQRGDANVLADDHNQVRVFARIVQIQCWGRGDVKVTIATRCKLDRSPPAMMADQPDMFDQRHFIDAMAAAGVRMLLPEAAPPLASYTAVQLRGLPGDPVAALRKKYDAVLHLATDCPLFLWTAAAEEEDLMWAALDALRPNEEAAVLVEQMGAAIVAAGAAVAATAAAAAATASAMTAATTAGAGATVAAGGGRRSAVAVAAAAGSAGGGSREGGGDSGSGGGGGAGFNFLHLRIENDWVDHCKRWESIADGIVRDNCYRNTEDSLAAQLGLFGFRNNTPLYVASWWPDVDPGRRDRGARGEVQVTTATRKVRFIGNSVSTFSALALLERRHRGSPAAYYNGGNVPLAAVLPPLLRLPWVFTHNSWTPSYEYMLKGAVRSALAAGTLKPYCMFTGDPSAPIVAWMERHNVTVLLHQPAWKERLEQLAAKSQVRPGLGRAGSTTSLIDQAYTRGRMMYSPARPCNSSAQGATSTPLTGQVSNHSPYRSHCTLWPLGSRSEAGASYSYSANQASLLAVNAGGATPHGATPAAAADELRGVSQQLEQAACALCSHCHGFTAGAGPSLKKALKELCVDVVQAVRELKLLLFYEADLRGSPMLPQSFNTKPYGPRDPAAFIVHFHGPKPHELLAYLAGGGKCEFRALCAKSFRRHLCRYVREWVAWVPHEPVALRLVDACAVLDNPVLATLRGSTTRHARA
ncbi:hypothetical protein TSOC_011920 [Tetrabaena socialis]|uniref:O-fucosyltransferase family protein n=1 Tax=Tetrabaena socialis TaxID=47790 RepID=A0A2J7ZPG1_9CHLO|nr:hypothetical protein TSOC_011920 [Tetrabaena socialis]|eukprot:PNH02132.1 hypothetical protein TSOC_011920 [Tetrabaena socialis]